MPCGIDTMTSVIVFEFINSNTTVESIIIINTYFDIIICILLLSAWVVKARKTNKWVSPIWVGSCLWVDDGWDAGGYAYKYKS